jgi:hypothetical protein
MGILSKVTGWATDYRETFACEHAYPRGFFHESLFVLKMAIIHRKM